MKIRNIEDIKKNINRSTIFIFLVIFSCALVGLYLTHSQFLQKSNLLYKSEILSACSNYKSNLSEKLSIIASSTVFLDYLHSGEETRKRLYSQFLSQISSLKPKSITGMQLLDDKSNVIFDYGRQSNSFISLKLCYLNQTLDPVMGNCQFSWKLYFTKSILLKEILAIKKSIIICQSCAHFNLFSTSAFGNFIINQSDNLDLNLEMKGERDYFFYPYLFLMTITLILFGFWSWYRLNSLLNKHIENPIKNLASNLKATNSSLACDTNIDEVQYLIDQINLWRSKINKIQSDENASKLGRIAAQLAHDIRSPLSAIDMLIKTLENVPEVHRTTLRNATLRISDIANNFLTQYRMPIPCQTSITTNEHIPGILEYIVSEKRSQYLNREIELSLFIDDESWSSFSYINSADFKRVLSNLINNSVEAISRKGKVNISLYKIKKYLRIEIKDNGCGISADLLPNILKGGMSIGKENGSGLGLSHANQKIDEWGGDLDIQSELGIGTIVGINLLLSEITPTWFCSSISIDNNTNILVLDDEKVAHQLWKDKISKIKDSLFTVSYFFNVRSFINFVKKKVDNNSIFLIDYELGYDMITGLEIIEQLNLSQSSILVTNRYDDHDIQKRCIQLGIKILPKYFISQIKLNI